MNDMEKKEQLMPEEALDRIRDIRTDLDLIDQAIMEKVAERQQKSAGIYVYKAALGMPIMDSTRDVLKLFAYKGADNSNISLAQAAVQKALLRHSRQQQYRQAMEQDESWPLAAVLKKPRGSAKKQDKQEQTIACLSVGSGAYSDAALGIYPGARIVPVRSLGTALAQVKDGVVGLAMLPVQGTAVGSVTELAVRLRNEGLYIIDDITVPRHHRLMVIPGSKLSNLRKVVGSTDSLEQSSVLIKKMGWQSEEVAHEGVATRLVSELKDSGVAALASVDSGELYNLQSLDNEMYPQQLKQARYLLVAKEPKWIEDANCMSLVIRISHQSGALVQTISEFSDRNINLKQVSSMPVEGRHWENDVYIEVEATHDDPEIMSVLYGLDHSDSKALCFLGWYQTTQLEG